jgi:corrinoid protein of di/trimethylamine methyltransferase
MGEELYQLISKAVIEGEDDEVARRSSEALEAGLPPLDIMHHGIVDGIQKIGELWKANEVFLPEVILAADAFKAGMSIVKPHLKEGESLSKGKKIVIGVVHGDVHDLGKSIVIAMWTSAGFEVIDLGIDVPLRRFIEAAREYKPAILGLGAYMTTTMLHMRDIIAELKKQELRQDMKVMVGGVSTSQAFADQIGADAWGKDALDALYKALEL